MFKYWRFFFFITHLELVTLHQRHKNIKDVYIQHSPFPACHITFCPASFLSYPDVQRTLWHRWATFHPSHTTGLLSSIAQAHGVALCKKHFCSLFLNLGITCLEADIAWPVTYKTHNFLMENEVYI